MLSLQYLNIIIQDVMESLDLEVKLLPHVMDILYILFKNELGPFSISFLFSEKTRAEKHSNSVEFTEIQMCLVGDYVEHKQVS